jgi:hypothetical protein
LARSDKPSAEKAGWIETVQNLGGPVGHRSGGSRPGTASGRLDARACGGGDAGTVLVDVPPHGALFPSGTGNFAIRALRCGMDIYSLSRHLAHTSVKTTEIYLAHPTGDEQGSVRFAQAWGTEDVASAAGD